MDQIFLDSNGVAKLLLTSRAAVHTLANRKKIPHLKCGHRLLFDRNEILRWLDSQRRVTAEEALRGVSA